MMDRPTRFRIDKLALQIEVARQKIDGLQRGVEAHKQEIITIFHEQDIKRCECSLWQVVLVTTPNPGGLDWEDIRLRHNEAWDILMKVQRECNTIKALADDGGLPRAEAAP